MGAGSMLRGFVQFPREAISVCQGGDTESERLACKSACHSSEGSSEGCRPAEVRSRLHFNLRGTRNRNMWWLDHGQRLQSLREPPFPRHIHRKADI